MEYRRTAVIKLDTPGGADASLRETVEQFNEEMAQRGGELLGELDRGADGTSGVDYEDALIGAAAEHVRERVLTDNVDDFETLGIDVETY